MAINEIETVQWDGNVLTGWILIDRKQKKFSADRNTIHQHAAGFNDALTWEIDRHRVEIFERLVPYFKRLHESRAEN